MSEIKAVILSNELEYDHNLWISACEVCVDKINFRVVDLTRDYWFKEIHAEKFDVLLAKPGGMTAPFKQLYDERIYILGKVLGHFVYPSVEEIMVYENKRFLSYWLNAKNIPHPDTFVFYSLQEVQRFLQSTSYPIVSKTNIGASGSGVQIIQNPAKAINYIQNSFSGKGAAKRHGPNFSKGGILRRGFHYVLNPGHIKQKLSLYKSRKNDSQKGFVIFQKFIQHDYEWRAVRIGESFFAHKKLKLGEKASGSLLKSYDNPPLSLLDFVKKTTDILGFTSVAVDIFDTTEGYLINEVQCIFGQSDPYQMLVDGTPGRYRLLNNAWHFEPGDFNQLESYKLRLDHIISILT